MRVTQRKWTYLGQEKGNSERFKHRREVDCRVAMALYLLLMNVN